MKFAKYIESESIPEWRRAYLNYKGLKKKLKYVERFRRTKERRAAVQLDNTFQDIDDENASMDNWPKREYPTNAYYWKNDLTERRPSIMSRISSRFAGRSTSRPASFRSSFTALSVLDEVLYHASPSEREFFDSLDYELNKISRFYDEKEKECKLKLEALKVQIEFIAEYGRHLLDLGVKQRSFQQHTI
ncbi:SPX domain-containing protein [Pilobolus umbonatus]|nr:SPX domain-containing protein [Pilobolus umbonatus]